MQNYLNSKRVILVIASILTAITQVLSEVRSAGAYDGKYTGLKCVTGEFGLLKLDPQLRYIAKIDANAQVKIWTLRINPALCELVYDSAGLKKQAMYEALVSVTTEIGLIVGADYPYPPFGEPGRKFLLWDPRTGALRNLKWKADFNKILFASPDGTRFGSLTKRWYKELSKGEALVNLWDLNGSKVEVAKVDSELLGDIDWPILMDKRNNLYVPRHEADSVAQTGSSKKLMLGMIRTDTQSYTVVSQTNAVLVTSRSDSVSPYKVNPILLEDGETFVTYIQNKTSGRYSITYYREGKLVKSVNDPVLGVGESRLAITSDGNGVLTQVIDGEKKGLVKVWDIESGKSSEIVKLPEIRYIFPWVQGKYAPIWTSSDGRTYEAGILEITH